jgi:hypothetical protein
LYDELLVRAEGLLGRLDTEERSQASRVLEIARSLAGRARQDGKLIPEAEDDGNRRELRSCVELLSRRSARALPMAKLGRAALADLATDPTSARTLLVECEVQFDLQGD